MIKSPSSDTRVIMKIRSAVCGLGLHVCRYTDGEILTGIAYRCDRFLKEVTCAVKAIEVYQLKNTCCDNLDLNIMSACTLKIT
jgi:hypothetical protein